MYKSRSSNGVENTLVSKNAGKTDYRLSLDKEYDKIVASSPFLKSQDYFERMVATGTSMNSILIIFDMTIDKMDTICQHWYGKGFTFEKVFNIVKEKGYAEARQMFNDLASSGNSAALNIVSRDLSIGDVPKSSLGKDEDGNGGIIINVNSSVIDRD